MSAPLPAYCQEEQGRAGAFVRATSRGDTRMEQAIEQAKRELGWCHWGTVMKRARQIARTLEP